VDLDRVEKRPPRLWEVITLGYSLHEAEGLRADTPLVSVSNDDLGANRVLQSLLGAIERFELRDTREVARCTLGQLLFRLERVRETNVNVLGAYTSDLRDSLRAVQSTLRDESASRYVYAVSPSKTLDVHRLLSEPSAAFGIPELLDPPLPPSVDVYLREAGRCLAIGFAPAAVLCTLAATETVFKYYYGRITGHRPGRRTWGQLVKTLKESEHECPQLVLRYLEVIVEDFRNPAMHSQLEIQDGMDLDIWMYCSACVQDMFSDLGSRELPAMRG
jgi:hypothetical protein